jgi:DNA-binding response OmpR family regulator
MKALLIEDDAEIIDSVKLTFQLRWPEVSFVTTFLGEKGVELAQQESPDIVILDLGLPDLDGFEVLRRIREFSDVLVIILTVRGEELNKIKGLELGADDYMVKPFSPGELLARLRALLRRSQMTEGTAKVAGKLSVRGKLRIDFNSQEVSIGDQLLKLSPREYELLCLLVANEGVSLSNQMLMDKVFPEHGADTRFLQVYINKLREKLEDDAGTPMMILDEGNKGYKFVGH